jgi:hypothetical protein
MTNLHQSRKEKPLRSLVLFRVLILAAGGLLALTPVANANPDSYTTVSLVHLDNVPILPPVSLPPVGTPPVGQEVARIIVRDEGANVCVDISLQQGAPQNLACIARLLLGPADGQVPRGETPLLVVPGNPAGFLGATPSINVSVDVSYQYDAAHVFEAASLLNHSVAVRLPFEPTQDGAGWFLQHGNDTALTITVTPYKDGVSQGTVSQSIPFLGQVLGAAGLGMPPLPQCPPDEMGAPPACIVSPVPTCTAGQDPVNDACIPRDSDGDGVPDDVEQQLIGSGPNNPDEPLPHDPPNWESCDHAQGLFYICKPSQPGLLGLGIRIHFGITITL